VYRFNADPTSRGFGQLLRTYANPIGGANALFGSSIDLGGNKLAVGAPGAGQVGGVYIYGGGASPPASSTPPRP